MPVKYFWAHWAIKGSNAYRGLIKDESSLLVGDVLSSGGVGGNSAASLTVHSFVHYNGEWFQASADTCLSRNEGDRLAFEVPFWVLKTHPIDFFIDGRLVIYWKVVGALLCWESILSLSLKTESVGAFWAKLNRKISFDGRILILNNDLALNSETVGVIWD